MPVAIPSRRYYETLELEPDDIGEEEIRAAYKKLALKWHPDRHTTDKEDAQQKFIEINEAQTVLLEYYQHRRRGSPHPEKRHRRGQSRPAPEAGAFSREHRSEDAQSPRSQTRNEPEPHSSRSSSHTSTTPPSSPKGSSQSKLHKDRPHRDDAGGAGRTSTSSRADLYGESYSGRQSHSKERSDAHTSPSEHANHASSERRPRDEGRRQHSSRSRDNLRAQSPSRHANDGAHAHSPHSPSHSHHDAEAYFTWPRKRQARQRSDDSSTSQRRPGFFPKRSKLDADPPSDLHSNADVVDYDFINLGTPIPPLRSPHHPSDHPRRDKDWTFPLRLTLDDLYHARAHHYRITRTLRSGATESVKIPIPVDPAWRTGTRVIVPGMGNERPDGTFQDIVFLVELEPHPRFMRQGDDLVAAVQVPWEEPAVETKAHEDQAYVLGMDGEEFALPIPRTLAEGANGTRVVGAGMPVIKSGRMVGKGDLIVRWEFVFNEGEHAQPSRWQNLRKVMGWRP
ncbi:DnaJ-domain-containing protein [Daedalea quercina L-15889]|uniref:DnaJ-domain-containing protein n=1 Tax=Daedalea quercina L-15889 TaxID=1314783 RepID=A0A165PAC4_9APHY|nr:DnaJ-domain-containing protein [Daedalea quercina L-15889]